ncbi:MAG: HEAT repeat domain-containing protein [Spirochaetales bacterium]|nr:HEAT repeat domain-containing protein [Spirochaetales bacterium]
MRSRLLSVAFIVLSAVHLSAQPAPVPKKTLAEWGETIEYGIDTQIIDIVKRIKASGETSLDGKLAAVLARSVNPDLRKEILGLFTAQKYEGAEAVAYAILTNYENEESDVLRAVVAYLAEIKSKRSLPLMLKLADADDNVLAYSAIAAVGRMGDQSMAETLLKKLGDPETKPDRKPTIITALGDMKAAAAAPELLKILGNRNEERVWRMYAAEALGKIGDASAVPVLKKALAENDPLLKSYVAAALGRFDLARVLDPLIECLKDSNWKVRVAACQGLARPGAGKAVDILIYKVKNDPEIPVQSEAMKALAAIGGAESVAFLRSYLLNTGKPIAMRQLVFTTLLEKDLNADTTAAIEKALRSDWTAKNGFVEWAAQTLSRTASIHMKKALVLLLDHPSSAVRVYAVRGVVFNHFKDLRGKLQEMQRRETAGQAAEELKDALEQL